MGSSVEGVPGIRFPRFAVVKLGSQPDIGTLFLKLQELGYFEVSFVHDLCDSPYFSSIRVASPPPKRRRRKQKVPTPVKEDILEAAPLLLKQENVRMPSITIENKPVIDHEHEDDKPQATAEIVVSDTPITLDSDDTVEGAESADDQTMLALSDDTDALTQLFSKDNISAHGFSRERDYKYKLESGTQHCTDCGRQFIQSQFKNILAHAKSHYQMKPWACPVCDYQCAEADAIRTHFKEEHPDQEDITPISNGIACDRLRSEWATVARRCFPNLSERIDKWENNVKKMYTSRNESKLDGISVIEQLSQHVRTEQVMNGGRWIGNLHIPCKLCGKVLACRDVSILVRHTKTHYPIKQFSCSQCEYTNAERRNMRQHVASTHPDADVDSFVDVRNADMEEAWMAVGKECFPDMSTRLDEAISSYKPKNNYKRHSASNTTRSSNSPTPSQE